MNRSLIGDSLRVVLAFGLVVYGMPAPAATAPVQDGNYYFQNGEGVYHVDYSDLLTRIDEALAGPGEISVVVKRARSSGRPAPDAPFVFGDTPSADEIVTLGSAAADVEDRTGKRLDRVQDWDEVVTWSVKGAAETVTTTFTVGVDAVAMTVPRAMLRHDGDEILDGSVVTVEVNGVPTDIDATVFRDLVAKPTVAAADLVATVGGRIIDAEGFINGVTGFLAVEAKARVEGPLTLIAPDALSTPSSCVPSCTSCAGAAMSNIAMYFALISSCGGALVTGGTSLVVCIGVFLALEASHLLLFGACGACYECANPSPPPPPTSPDPEPCPCEGEPLCDCAPGQSG